MTGFRVTNTTGYGILGAAGFRLCASCRDCRHLGVTDT